MMPGKRALVVDDSRSARVVLSRMLERYGIEVDSAESAESALEYLKDRRPDVIFMDHLMPGMDGLQAVREIKANPELAAIPIMMYTSQEGEIYGGQARASGAVGVLPKSIRPIVWSMGRTIRPRPMCAQMIVVFGCLTHRSLSCLIMYLSCSGLENGVSRSLCRMAAIGRPVALA